MTEYKLNNCTVRIHGGYDPENIKRATTAYLKKAETIKRRKIKAAEMTAAEQRKGA